MKPQDSNELQWVGIDLHVHTPASRDYRGPREKSEYMAIIRKANEFGAPSKGSREQKHRSKTNPIECIAFTDHNSVEGFRAFRSIQAEIDSFSKLIRERDPSNPLVVQLDDDNKTLRSCRVLMGVEVKADPGIHLLVVFAEAIEPASVASFLEEAHGVAYETLAGDPTPTTKWTLKGTLDQIQERFQDSAFVVFPHVDSSGGVYEDLKDFPQLRISALTHPVVRALSFNKVETRERLNELFSQPDYKRSAPVALIQTSDFHGETGTAVGQPRTEVNVRDGKPTFKNLREAFREKRVKCSVDFVAEEYAQLTEGMYLARFDSRTEKLGFKEDERGAVAEAVSAMLNCDGGIIELDGNAPITVPDETLSLEIKDQLVAIFSDQLDPTYVPTIWRVFRLSPGKVRVLFRIPSSRKLHTVSGRVHVEREGASRMARSHEIEAIASSKVTSRFGRRFENTLGRLSSQSKFLSKLPAAIPMLLENQSKIIEGLPGSIKVSEHRLPGAAESELYDVVEDLAEKQRELYPFGYPQGNCTIVTPGVPFRHKQHYVRFTTFRGQADTDMLSRYGWLNLESPAIGVHLTGCVGLIEPGFLISSTPIALLKPTGEWQDKLFSLLAWVKSSFFIWFCAVCSGEDNPFIAVQFKRSRILLPNLDETRFMCSIGQKAKLLVDQEQAFMDEINRLKKKGNLDDSYREKLRARHNSSANSQCLRIDEEIFSYLGISDKLQISVARTLNDLQMADYGLLQQLEPED